jgi:hypothetical protein
VYIQLRPGVRKKSKLSNRKAGVLKMPETMHPAARGLPADNFGVSQMRANLYGRPLFWRGMQSH